VYCAKCGTWVPDDATACAQCGFPRAAAPASHAAAYAASPAHEEPALALPVVTVHYGGFWRRFFASLIDGLVLYFPNAILRVLAGLPASPDLRPLAPDQVGRSLGITAIMVVGFWWYSGRLESSRWQGTLGQQLLGLRVTDVHGRRISFLRATGRHFAQWISLLLCGLGYLFNLWTSRRQTLHDLIAGCVIVRVSPAPATAPVPAPLPGRP
jgi:uncharacterized RDD family membrane protein YckC